jgi:peptidoglycan/LPS O-acetylase OafA/YrhL
MLSTRQDNLLSRSASRSASARSVLTRHMPGLDLLRGVAILAVVFFHGFYYVAPTFPWHNRFAAALFHLTSFGWIGVNLFFTLSGFLITGNLIDSERNPNYYSRFYIRRALRILPVYFLVLILLGLTRTASLNYLLACVIFLANWPKLLLHGPILLYPVLWSLAVEEQFYAVWPWLYRKLRMRGLFALSIAMILFCPVLRGAAITRVGASIFSKTFLIGDNLAIGAVIAIICRWPQLTLNALFRIGVAAVCISVAALLIFANAGYGPYTGPLGASVVYSMVEWFTGGILILTLYAYRATPVQPALRFLVFFADISYGLYLIHMLCGILYDRVFGDAYLTRADLLVSRFVVVNGIAILLATLSKRYFENPIMRLKGKFPATMTKIYGTNV